MTPHTPVDTLESIVADVRRLAEWLVSNCGTHLPLTVEAREKMMELRMYADRLASLPVEGWRPISEAPAADFVGTQPPICLVWSRETGIQIGRAWRYPDGNTVGQAFGFSGEWNISHWHPLPAAPQGQRQGNEQGGAHE